MGSRINIAGNIEAVKERNNILFNKKKREKKVRVQVKINKPIKVLGKTFRITKLPKIPVKFPKEKHIEIISGDNIKNDFILRNWKEGDKIRLLGMEGTKKVSDVLTDLKVLSSNKGKHLVLLNNNEIVWLVGVQINDKYKITNETKSVLKLCLS